MRMLDLFCGAGGCAVGYHRAVQELGIELEIIGVDIAPQKRYPFTFIQADAMTFPLNGFDFIHASPPCQDYSPGSRYGVDSRGAHHRLIIPTRDRLKANGAPWILENVRGAHEDMYNPVRLCGTSLGLRVQRHRLFDSSHLFFSAGPCNHRPYDVSVRCKRSEYLLAYTQVVTRNGICVHRPPDCPKSVAQVAMGIDWMTTLEMGEAIPPAYTEWLGRQMFTAISSSLAT